MKEAIAAAERRIMESEFGTPAILDAVEELFDLGELAEIDRLLGQKEAEEKARFQEEFRKDVMTMQGVKKETRDVLAIVRELDQKAIGAQISHRKLEIRQLKALEKIAAGKGLRQARKKKEEA